jgi:hypothetical protein
MSILSVSAAGTRDLRAFKRLRVGPVGVPVGSSKRTLPSGKLRFAGNPTGMPNSYARCLSKYYPGDL